LHFLTFSFCRDKSWLNKKLAVLVMTSLFWCALVAQFFAVGCLLAIKPQSLIDFGETLDSLFLGPLETAFLFCCGYTALTILGMGSCIFFLIRVLFLVTCVCPLTLVITVPYMAAFARAMKAS
jgi:hypothetical protein